MLADYINFNTDQRADAGKAECKGTFFKMMKNALYGQTIENVSKRINIKVLTDIKKARQISETPNCINFWLFNSDLVVVESRKSIR